MIYNKNLVAYIDLHGHSIKKNSFIYGARFAVNDPKYYGYFYH